MVDNIIDDEAPKTYQKYKLPITTTANQYGTTGRMRVVLTVTEEQRSQFRLEMLQSQARFPYVRGFPPRKTQDDQIVGHGDGSHQDGHCSCWSLRVHDQEMRRRTIAAKHHVRKVMNN